MSHESPRGSARSPLSWATSLPPEIWTLVGKQIQSQVTLRKLVRVCRTFRAAFTPLLYAKCMLPLNKWTTTQLGQKDLPNVLHHTKDFEVRVPEFAEYHTTYDASMNDDYALFVVRMLEQMPNLQNFRWVDDCFERDFSPSLMLRNPQLLGALKSCQSLRELSIQFTGQLMEDTPNVHNLSIPLKGFRHLSSLELYCFHGDESNLIKIIAGALWDSSGLKTLGLGMLCYCDCEDYPEILVLEPESIFLEKLCIQYGSRRNPTPLTLETLRLGHGICLIKSKSPAASDYLAKLTIPTSLRTLHVFNGYTRFGIDDEEECLRIDWSLLKDCTSLLQLSVTRLEDDVRMWLNNGGRSVQELIVTEHYQRSDLGLENFDLLDLPQLSMLFTRETTVSEGNINDSSETDSSDSWTDMDSGESDSLDTDTSGEKLSDVLDVNPEIFRKKPHKTAVTVLDRLKNGGSQLTRLGLCLDFETQWVQFASHLPNLKRLNQLRVNSKSHRSGQYPTKASSLWPDIYRPKDIAYRYAELIQAKCPSLQLIRIQDWVWQVLHDQPSAPEVQDNSLIKLLELEKDEILDIDLFTIEHFAEQNGLSGRLTLKDIKEISEEEQDRTDRIFARIDEAWNAGLISEDGRLPDGWMDEFNVNVRGS